jgi:signal transduction histidine kinase
VKVGDRDGTVVFEVADNGVGMDCEIKNKVFTTFFTTKGMGGTGLGLLVTRKIVQEHGGRVAMESVPAEGSVFRIELPRQNLPAPAGRDRKTGGDAAQGEKHHE